MMATDLARGNWIFLISCLIEKIMSRIVYVNGTYVPEAQATVSIFDRGYVFGDGIYEVAAVLDGKLVDSPLHKWRLQRSLAAVEIPMPMPWEHIESMQRDLIRLNNLDQGLVYYQVTRGVADRDFSYNSADLAPTLSAFTQVKALDPCPLAAKGVKVVTCPDIRWQRRDIKSLALLGQVMAKQQAKQAGAFEALMVEHGFVTEGGSSSFFMIDHKDQLIVRPGGGNDILPGLTRMAMLELADQCQITIVERAFTVEEFYQAKEAFLTAATLFVMPVVQADDQIIADGAPGPLTCKLRELLIKSAYANLS